MEYQPSTTLKKNLKPIALVFLLTLFGSNAVVAEETEYKWYRCIVKASSHTGYYTFKISTKPCKIYWREIDTEVDISECNLPVIAGLKPSAQDDKSIIWFNLKTLAFYDYLSGVLDRGTCTVSEEEPGPYSSNKQI